METLALFISTFVLDGTIGLLVTTFEDTHRFGRGKLPYKKLLKTLEGIQGRHFVSPTDSQLDNYTAMCKNLITRVIKPYSSGIILLLILTVAFASIKIFGGIEWS